jgi:hypothetical protein
MFSRYAFRTHWTIRVAAFVGALFLTAFQGHAGLK